MKKKRILFIVQLPPPVHGASSVNKDIVENPAINEQYSVKVMPLRFVSNIHDIEKFSLRKIWLMITHMFRLISLMISFRPQLVYFTIAPKGGAFFRDALYVAIIKLFNPAIIFHLHSRGIQQAMASGMKRRIYRFVYRGAYVITFSELLKREFDGLAVKRIFILPNAIPDVNYDLQKRDSATPVILFLSNYLKAKGIFVFIDMLKKLQEQQYTFKAAMVGMDGDFTADELRAIVTREKLDDRVIVAGPKYGADKHAFFESASIFVMPSLNEAFPLTILEALQASMPTVASAVGGIPDMIKDGETGYLCNAGDANAFAEKTGYLLANPGQRKMMGDSAFLHFTKNYRKPLFESRVLDILEAAFGKQ